jgi:16S rRNA (guanine527-N7)-methyltransferase
MASGNSVAQFKATLEKRAPEYGVSLTAAHIETLGKYYQLLEAWNSRLHLVAPTTPENFATRHVLESLLILEYLTEKSSLIDVGSGAGLPIIPALIVKPDITANLIEASRKKAVFLREALTETGLASRAHVLAERFENTTALNADFVTCRALERFEAILPQLISWAPDSATLLFFGGPELGKKLQQADRTLSSTLIPKSQKRFLFVSRKSR